MNKSVNVVLVLIFSSLGMGLYAQCDSMKTYEDAPDRIFIKIDPNDFYQGAQLYDPNDPPPPPPAETRRIYFIHGLGGDAMAWEKAAEACWNKSLGLNKVGFPARQCIVDRPDYNNSTGSLASAADGLRSAISVIASHDRSIGLDPKRAILIGHSQGGLVMRQLMNFDMVQYPNHITKVNGEMNYGGIVTVASSLQGAKILDNRGDIFALANDGCKKLVVGPTIALLNNVSVDLNLGTVASWFVKEEDIKNAIRGMLGNILGNIVPTVCDAATNDIMPMFFKHYYAGITEDYKIGASTINTLNNDVSKFQYNDFPKVVFYAVEPQENIFWRTLNWMLYNPNGNNGPNAPNIDYFGANDDWFLYDNRIKNMIAHYQAKKEYHRIMSDFWWSILDKTKNKNKKSVLTAAIYAEYASIGYGQGLEWFNNINETWKTIIGARVQNGNTITYKDNDGIVLAESAANLPGSNKKVVRIEGSSHMQIRNDGNIKRELNYLFNGDTHPWFYVAPQ